LADTKAASKAQARAALGLPPDAFIVSFVAANQQTHPNYAVSRKGIEKALIAWRLFTERHKEKLGDALLYMHTYMPPDRGGLDISALIRMLGFNPQQVQYTSPFDYERGLSAEYLALLYNAADVHLNPAMGGGFELTLVEAQACGTPVITTDFTAMAENAWAGWKLGAKDQLEFYDLMWWHPNLLSWRMNVNPSKIVTALEYAVSNRNDNAIFELAINGAKRFDKDRVLADYWMPLLKRIEDDIAKRAPAPKGSTATPKLQQAKGEAQQA
jgi:glycosyltransferase involved in cell wall biosynthesis